MQVFEIILCRLVFAGELKFNHLKKPYFVTMGSYNMAIMLQFNQAESLTLQDISAATQLPEKELIRQMQALVEAKIIFTEVSIQGSLGHAP